MQSSLGTTNDVPNAQQQQKLINLAVADVKCEYSTGYAQTVSATFRNATNHLPASQYAELVGAFNTSQLATTRAQALTAH
jgi:hypothetical protein